MVCYAYLYQLLTFFTVFYLKIFELVLCEQIHTRLEDDSIGTGPLLRLSPVRVSNLIHFSSEHIKLLMKLFSLLLTK